MALHVTAKGAVAVAVPDGPLRHRLLQILGRTFRRVEVLDPARGLAPSGSLGDVDLLVVQAGVGDGFGRLDHALVERAPRVLVLADDPSSADQTRWIAAGATDVLSTGTGDAELRDTLLALEEGAQRPPAPDVGPEGPTPSLADFASHNRRMRTFVEFVRRLLDVDTTLLIQGETGVGKEHLARAIHAEGARREHRFVTVNCGALPETLLESELFGHERGAFTGAAAARRGLFEVASGGTIFLDEVGEMPSSLQVKLLTVLQRHEIRPLGAETPRPVDVRVVAATNRDLSADVESGRFRRDLFYRLNVVPLTIPPLRDRREDLPVLLGSLLRLYRERMGRQDVGGIHPAALDAMLGHAWPGNVREVINTIERAMLVARGDEITVADLPPSLGGGSPEGPEGPDVITRTFLDTAMQDRPLADARRELIERFERAYLTAQLRSTHGRVGATAAKAGISARSLYDKMRHHGLRKEDFRR